MTARILMTASALAILASTGYAQDFRGASLGLGYTSDIEDDVSSDGTIYHGAVEYGITGPFAAAANLSFFDFGDTLDGSNLTIHGIYELNPTTSLGLFLARDNLDSGDANVFGLEAATRFTQGGEAQGYFGRASDDDEDVNLFGISGSYGFGDNFGVEAEYDLASSVDDDITTSTLSLGATYALYGPQNGPELFVKWTNISIESDDVESDADFISLGAQLNLGNNGGTTFNSRSFTNALLPF